ncbi:preprotein translocase subunit YajC [Plantibacter sp. VKM Ac-2885]|jgi:preprotein translocase subunit YajC|uniref:preprotein translocase subunit YajC n=1 Tax=Plantibacter sp. VKM Ac-2885 TaxID=2783828 RepID=UPI00188A5C7C|nr:preprotein translocase subunit YajC [Plantibacter sp. VKM Ac-2885]MBF4513024.1 preprotein translocase subunit YajC [Plantibacter sp. VKM Ac-2885]
MTLVLFGLAGVMIVFMMVSNNKRKKQAAVTEQKLVPGAEVLTGFGVYGTLISMDRDSRKADVEIAPGVIVTIDPRYAGAVVAPTVAETAEETPVVESIPDDASSLDLSKPEFGQRVEDTSKPQKSDD